MITTVLYKYNKD